MVSLNMAGPFDLTSVTIDSKVAKTQAGNYALGKMGSGDKASTFIVGYIGRSDDDVAGRLNDHIGEYWKFKYSYASSMKAAFEEECRNYHDFKPPGNTSHPGCPVGSGLKCPHC
jgi:hypothetical protein